MAEKIVECVPNISEGRDLAVIDDIVAAAAEVAGVRVLDVDPGAETNRTVITLVGDPEPIEEGGFPTDRARRGEDRHAPPPRGARPSRRDRRMSVHPGERSDDGGLRRDRAPTR